MDTRTPPVPARRLLRDRRLLFLNRPTHPVNSIATLEFPMRRRRSGSNTFSHETLSINQP
ncbi:hypothetical protein RvY_01280 [Ramazzottius varieornatus]|uniref:Uncharacterized protein n=1 Tax=Ramazzottius varieornatus TaxID=947166 RepID=A0A1D1UGN0_RAMVA|nr:hypothetical protein RvY_01280 [Ramazzottius varieornatus]